MNDTIQALHNEKNDLQAERNILLYFDTGDVRYSSTIIQNSQEQTVILSHSTINQGSGQETPVKSFNCPHSGYLEIYGTSTTTNCYIVVQFWYENHLYTFKETTGTSGMKYFLVLPTTSLTVYVGNTNWWYGATHTVSITYRY